ncbi:MAG: hypothetical protein JWN03_1724 [Nocardia sp.]|uniref:hypothetical protein n=1 Tax=Nocardia sp. TaxID=1821 RepID=UPI00262CA9E6|nr:hypothetical protein [Nocardia sp.]MCU1641449.1 hypothetical protein [Nocardia sp.]
MVRSGDQIHAYLVNQVNRMLRRLSMFGGEPALWTTFDHLYFLEGDEDGIENLRQSWRDRNAFTPTGVKGALQKQLPHNDIEYALASIYGEVARNRGWLQLDRTLTGDEYTALCAEIAAFTELDRTWTDVVGIFGEPSVLFGGSNPLYGKSLGYATANVSDPMVIFHLWNGVDPGAEPNWPPKVFGSGLAGDPLRRRLFPRLLLFTPEGHRRRPRI